MHALNAARFYFIGIRSPKFYKYYFSKEHKQETIDKFFPLWPLRQKPLFNQYKSKTSKWTRQCSEHYEYVKAYLSILLNEYEFRYKKPHGLTKFLEWLEVDAPKLDIPKGNLKKITVPWKNINPYYRRKDIYESYRAQYKHVMKNDGIQIDSFKNRDIPEFLVEKDNKWLD